MQHTSDRSVGREREREKERERARARDFTGIKESGREEVVTEVMFKL